MKELCGKRVLITGAARGIGKALACRMAGRSAELLLADIDAEALDRTAQEIRQDGATVHTFSLDASEIGSMTALRDRVHEGGGPIDVLVNNAGVVFGGAFLDVPLEQHARTYSVNTLGVVMMTHLFLPDLIGRREAHLVNVSSAASMIGLPFGTTYASSKWAVTGFSESIRLELRVLGHRHVGVTTVCPGYVRTDLFRGATPPRGTAYLEPEAVADMTLGAIERRRTLVLAPWLVRLTPILKGVLPRTLFDASADLLGATSGMRSWSGSATMREGH